MFTVLLCFSAYRMMYVRGVGQHLKRLFYSIGLHCMTILLLRF